MGRLWCSAFLQMLSLRRYCSLKNKNFYFHPTFYANSEQNEVLGSFTVINNFISIEEETKLLAEAEKTLKRIRYEEDHWDAAILGYRETEKRDWNTDNQKILQRVRERAFKNGAAMPLVHVLDLKAEGVIKPHIDSIKFCGDTIAGISLLTDAVMRLTKEKDTSLCVDVLLSRRSLYIMTGPARYQYNHAILSGEESVFDKMVVTKGRRISVICRNDPS